MRMLNIITITSLVVATFLLALSNAYEVIAPPKNVVGRQNERLELNCTLAQSSGTERYLVQWTTVFYGESASRTIYSGYPNTENPVPEDYTSQFESSTSRNNLIIKSLTNTLAGGYKCQATDDLGKQRNRQIRVTAATEVECLGAPSGILDEGDTPEFICQMRVSGDELEPVFQWYRNGKLVQGLNKPNEMTDSPAPAPQLHRHSYNFTVTSDDHDVPFECRLSFRYAGKGGVDIDTSDPFYTDSCSIDFGVYFGAKDTEISPNQDGTAIFVNVGDTLNCSARGNPEVSYKWVKMQGDGLLEITEEQNLLVTEDMYGSTLNIYNCTAYNNIRGQNYEASASISFYADMPNGAGKLTNQSAFLWTIAALLLFMSK